MIDAGGTALVADQPHYGGAGYAPGAAVRVGIDAAGARVLPAA